MVLQPRARGVVPAVAGWQREAFLTSCERYALRLYALYTIVLRDLYDFLDVIALKSKGECNREYEVLLDGC